MIIRYVYESFVRYDLSVYLRYDLGKKLGIFYD